MAPVRESKIEKHLKKEVQATGGKVRKLKWIGKSGAPDRLMWWPRKDGEPHAYAFVELKAPGKKPTKIQEEEHAALREDGWTVITADSIEAVDAAILLVRDGVVYQPKERVEAPTKALTPRALKKVTEKYIDVKTPANLPVQDNSDLA